MCFIAATCDDDRLRAALQRLLVGASSFARELDREPLRRELDRRQRILDLVREPPRDLGPRGVALRLHELGHVVEHDDVARRPAPPAAAIRASAACATDSPRASSASLLPLPVAAAAKALGDELGERRERRQAPAPLGERHARSGRRAAAAGSPRALGFDGAQPVAARRTRARRRTGCRGCSRDTRASSRSRGATSSAFCHALRRAAPVIVLNDSVEHAELVARSRPAGGA